MYIYNIYVYIYMYIYIYILYIKHNILNIFHILYIILKKILELKTSKFKNLKLSKTNYN